MMKRFCWLLLALCLTILNAAKPIRPLLRINAVVKAESRKDADISKKVRKVQSAAFTGGLYGAAAGSLQVISLMWLRTIVNYQYRYGVSLSDACKELYQQGGVCRFYRGVSYALIQNPLSKFGSVASNEASRALLGRAAPVWASLLSTVLSVLWKVLLMPLETVKTILQVDGSVGLEHLLARLRRWEVAVLFEGTAAAMLSTFASHGPWYLVHNTLDHSIPLPAKDNVKGTVLRSAAIGLTATAVSDMIANSLRVVKTVKQAIGVTGKGHTYREIVLQIYTAGGAKALFGRGLAARMLANSAQAVLFIVVWKILPIYVDRWKNRKSSSTLIKPMDDIVSVDLA